MEAEDILLAEVDGRAEGAGVVMTGPEREAWI